MAAGKNSGGRKNSGSRKNNGNRKNSGNRKEKYRYCKMGKMNSAKMK